MFAYTSYLRKWAAMGKSELEISFAWQLKHFGLPEPQRQYRFHPKRKWMFDFAWPDVKVAVEIEGGTWTNGRHTRGSGFEGDCEKYNAAGMDGWLVLRFIGKMVESGEARLMTEEALNVFKKKQEA